MLLLHCTRTLFGAAGGDAKHMERAKDALVALLGRSKLQDAANNAVINRTNPAPGWDPFEIWRTRVRDAREQDSTDGDKTTG